MEGNLGGHGSRRKNAYSFNTNMKKSRTKSVNNHWIKYCVERIMMGGCSAQRSRLVICSNSLFTDTFDHFYWGLNLGFWFSVKIIKNHLF